MQTRRHELLPGWQRPREQLAAVTPVPFPVGSAFGSHALPFGAATSRVQAWRTREPKLVLH